MVILTNDQLRELDRLTGLKTIFDPRTSLEYVLIPKHDLKQLKADRSEEQELDQFLQAAAASVFESMADEERADGQSW